jgi:flagellar motor switch protein FliG
MKVLGTEKAAILLMSLHEDSAREIMNSLDSDEINTISVAMAKLGNIDSETVEKVLIEFVHDLNQSLTLVGNSKTAEKFLRKVLDEGKIGAVLDKMRSANTNTVWEVLSNLDDNAITQFVKNEYPQTAALILSKIPGYKAAKVLKLLNSEYSAEVINRIVSLNKVKTVTLENLEKVIESELKDKRGIFNTDDNNRIVAEIFNNFSKDDEQYFMNVLKERNPLAAKSVARMMFTFDELAYINPHGIQILIQSVDNNTIIHALSDSSDIVKDAFLGSMSQRVARMVTDEITSSRISKKDSIDAQNRILKIAKRMIADGSIVIEKTVNNDE